MPVHSLPPSERITYYKAMATQSLELARTSQTEEQKASRLGTGARWNALATEVEALLERVADTQVL